MLPTEDLFVYVYVLVDDAVTSGAVRIPARPGPAPGCSDAELLTIALVRHLPSFRPMRPTSIAASSVPAPLLGMGRVGRRGPSGAGVVGVDRHLGYFGDASQSGR